MYTQRGPRARPEEHLLAKETTTVAAEAIERLTANQRAVISLRS